MRRSLVLVAVASLSLPLVGCGGGGDGGEVVDVTINTFQFAPNPVEVQAGTVVRFVNEDPTTHTVTAGTRDDPEPDRFDERLAEDGTAEVTFDDPGRYPYFCAIHSGPGMTGEVVVSE